VTPLPNKADFNKSFNFFFLDCTDPKDIRNFAIPSRLQRRWIHTTNRASSSTDLV